MASYQVLGHGQGEGGRLHHSIDEEGRVVVESQNDRLFHPAAAPAAARAGHVDRPGAQPHRPPDGDVDKKQRQPATIRQREAITIKPNRKKERNDILFHFKIGYRLYRGLLIVVIL